MAVEGVEGSVLRRRGGICCGFGDGKFRGWSEGVERGEREAGLRDVEVRDDGRGWRGETRFAMLLQLLVRNGTTFFAVHMDHLNLRLERRCEPVSWVENGSQMAEARTGF